MRVRQTALRMTRALQLDPAPSSTSRLIRRRFILESAFLVLLVAAAFVLRLWTLSQVRFWDEAVYLQNADVICCGKTNYSELDSRPPLLSILFAAVFIVWHHVYAACIVTALLNALGPLCLYGSGRMIAGPISAAIAALLLAFTPFFVGVFPPGFISDATGNGLLSDSPALTLIALGFWLLLRALHRQNDLRFAWAGFALALAVLMRFASLSTVGVLALLVFAADRWWRAALACAAGLTAGIGPYLCWSRLRYGGFLHTFQHGWTNFEGPGESFSFYLRNFGNIFSWITLAGLALWIVRRAWEYRENRRQENQDGTAKPGATEHRLARHGLGKQGHRLEAFLWLWAAALLVFFSALHHKEPRYAMPVAPPLFLLAGIGLGTTVKLPGRAARIAGTVILVGGLALTFAPDRHRFDDPFLDDEESEEMRVSAFLNENLRSGTILYANFNYPVFAWQTYLPVHRLPESGTALYDALNRLPGDGILIVYKPNDEIAEPRLEWLDRNPHFVLYREFSRIVLYRTRAVR